MKNSIPSKAQVRGWKITPAATEVEPAPTVEPARRDTATDPAPDSADTTLRHGYTLASITRLARWVVSHGRYQGSDAADRIDAAWFAMIEHLYTCDTPPHPSALTSAGISGVDRYIAGEMHAHGQQRTERGGGTLPSFERYWTTGTHKTPIEDRVVERIALKQIMPLLTARQAEVVHALAAAENYRGAAQLLDMNPATFNVTIRNARRRFLAAWHQGETPSGTWGNDRRVGSYSTTEAPKTKRRAATSNLHRRMAGGR